MSEHIYAYDNILVCDDKYILLPREEITRCKECVYYESDLYKHFDCELHYISADPDGFCAWGERRDDA